MSARYGVLRQFVQVATERVPALTVIYDLFRHADGMVALDNNRVHGVRVRLTSLVCFQMEQVHGNHGWQCAQDSGGFETNISPGQLEAVVDIAKHILREAAGP